MDRDQTRMHTDTSESLPPPPQQQNDLLTAQALKDLQQNEQRFTESLREQLDKARKDKATLEADLESRAKAFQATLDQLQSNPLSENKSLEMLMGIDNLDELRAETKKLHEKYVAQEARIKKLEFELEMEQGHVNILRHDNQMLRQMTVDMTALAEQEEEYISNKLLKRISGLKKEKGELLIQVEQEEEYLTNMLQKKLSQLQKEKVDLENALEQEQEYIVNKLQKQLDSLRLQQTLSQSPSRSSSFVMDTSTTPGSLPMSPAVTGAGTSPSLSAKKWMPTHSPGTSGDLPPTGLVEVLKAEVATLKNKTIDMEKEFINKYQQCNKYKSELVHFRKEHNMTTDDIPADEGIPVVFRSVPPSPGRHVRGKRSTSTSSQRSITSDKTSGIPPLQLDNSVSTSTTSSIQHEHHISSHSSVAPQAIPDTSRSRSDSISSSSSSLPRRDISARRISGGMFGLHSPPPQHPPHP